jgi:pterin-4a-carbinolamine dehydratase
LAHVIGAARIAEALDALEGWDLQGHSLQRLFPVSDRHRGIAFLDEIRLMVAGTSESVVRSELSRTSVRVVVRSPGYVGVTDADLELVQHINAAAQHHLGPEATDVPHTHGFRRSP